MTKWPGNLPQTAYPKYSGNKNNPADNFHTIFSSSPYLGKWPKSSIDRLIQAGQIQNCPDGSTILEFGAPCSEIHAILSGSVELSIVTSGGKCATFCYVGPGEIINFIPTLDGQSSMHNQTAHGKTVLFRIPRQALLDEFAKEPATVRLVLDLFVSRSRLLHWRIANMMLSTLRSRLAAYLYFFSTHYGRETECGVEIGLRLSQEQLASLLGVSRQSVNKEMTNFTQDHVIETRYNTIIIKNLEKLREISTSD